MFSGQRVTQGANTLYSVYNNAPKGENNVNVSQGNPIFTGADITINDKYAGIYRDALR